MKDVKDMNVVSENKRKLMDAVKQGWDTFHRYGMWITFAVVIGICIGLWTGNKYFTMKMNDAIKVGGFVLLEKVYTVSPR